jgi:hypothetical protein
MDPPSDHFLFVGEVSERQMRGIAVRLEQFEVVGQVVSEDVTQSPVPPLSWSSRMTGRSCIQADVPGKPVALAGYFVGMEDVNYIAVNAEQEALA